MTPPDMLPATPSAAAPQSRGPLLTGASLTGPLPFAVALLLAELLLAAAVRANLASLAVWLCAHLAVLTLAAIYLTRSRSAVTDLGPYGLSLVATAISGPVGAAMGIVAVWLLARERPNVELLAAWYERIALAADVDPVTSLCNTVAMGRGVQTTLIPPPVFEHVMASGTLEDRQTALGLIARRFQPSYAAALRMALVSPEPVIRVQAAAVAVKVRAELKTAVQAMVAKAQAQDQTPTQAAELAAELEAMARAGMLEEDDQRRAESSIANLLKSSLLKTSVLKVGLPDGERLPAGPPQVSPQAQDLIESELLRQGRYPELRALRHAASLAPPNGEERTNA
jgi:ribosomal protein S20